MSEHNKMKTALYRYFAADGKLLYVGMSGNWMRRQIGHRSHSDWFGLVATMKVEYLPNRKAALKAEAAAIKSEMPAYNSSHNEQGPAEIEHEEKGVRRPNKVTQIFRFHPYLATRLAKQSANTSVSKTKIVELALGQYLTA